MWVDLDLVIQVFIYGGVGPLHSDVTVAGVAKAFGVRTVRHIDRRDPSHVIYIVWPILHLLLLDSIGGSSIECVKLMLCIPDPYMVIS